MNVNVLVAVCSGGHRLGLGGASLTYLSTPFLILFFEVVLWMYKADIKQSIAEQIDGVDDYSLISKIFERDLSQNCRGTTFQPRMTIE